MSRSEHWSSWDGQKSPTYLYIICVSLVWSIIIPMTFDDWFVPMTYYFYVMRHIWLNHTNDIWLNYTNDIWLNHTNDIRYLIRKWHTTFTLWDIYDHTNEIWLNHTQWHSMFESCQWHTTSHVMNIDNWIIPNDMWLNHTNDLSMSDSYQWHMGWLRSVGSLKV